MKIKDLVLKLTVSCLCLGSTYAIASPELSNNSKIQISNLPAKTPGTLLSIQAQNTDLFPNASQRFLITYRSRGIQS